jgi:hypothetical protein
VDVRGILCGLSTIANAIYGFLQHHHFFRNYLSLASVNRLYIFPIPCRNFLRPVTYRLVTRYKPIIPLHEPHVLVHFDL